MDNFTLLYVYFWKRDALECLTMTQYTCSRIQVTL